MRRIAALSAPLPDDVAGWVSFLREHIEVSDEHEKQCDEIADMLERLQWENTNRAMHLRDKIEINISMGLRIAELESEIAAMHPEGK